METRRRRLVVHAGERRGDVRREAQSRELAGERDAEGNGNVETGRHCRVPKPIEPSIVAGRAVAEAIERKMRQIQILADVFDRFSLDVAMFFLRQQ